MKPKLLSICIPTYNREKFLDEAISSIISQDLDDEILNKLEICISDNASTDNTDILIDNWKKNSKIDIVYHKNEVNIGPDLNYLKVIDVASAKYCWFLGSDDTLKSGTIISVLEHLNDEHDIFLLNRTICDFEMHPIKEEKWLKGGSRSFDFNNEADLITYFKLSNSIGSLFSYLSSIVFLRDKWNKVEYDPIFTGSAYSHVFKLFSIRNFGCKVKYIHNIHVNCRTGNDFFAESGMVKRFLIDIDGYILLSERLFEYEDRIRHSFLEVMKKEKDYWEIMFLKFNTGDKEWKNISKKLYKYPYNPHFLKFLSISPSFILNILVVLYKLRYKVINLRY